MRIKFCAAIFALFLAVMPLYAAPKNDSVVVVISLDAFPAYALKDPRLPIPTIRALARNGSIADSMRPINPTITWPNHTSLVTGVDASKHHVMFNGLLTYPALNLPVKIEQWRDKTDMVGVETVYDAAFRAGLTTAQVDWVAIYNAKTITWQFPEIPNPDGKIERAMVDANVVTQDQLRTFGKGSIAWRDRVWTEAAAYILRTDRPNLMLFHLLDLDSTQHQYGPMNTASYNAMAFLDDRVKDIIEAVRASGQLEKTTFLLMSDHGSREAKRAINLNVLLQQNEIVHNADGHLTADAWVIPEGGCAMVYISDPSKKSELLPKLQRLFEKVEGVKHVYDQEEYGKIGLPVKKDSDL